jgi:hypothetical protein
VRLTLDVEWSSACILQLPLHLVRYRCDLAIAGARAYEQAVCVGREIADLETHNLKGFLVGGGTRGGLQGIGVFGIPHHPSFPAVGK